MSYFRYLPTAEFYQAGRLSTSTLTPGTVGNVKNLSYGITLRDIMVRYRIRNEVLSSSSVFYPYQWREGDRPDLVAFDYYGDEDYWWVVYYSNNAFDYKLDFALSYEELLEVLVRKYMGNYFAILEFTIEDATGNFTVGEWVTDNNTFYGMVTAWNPTTGILSIKTPTGNTPIANGNVVFITADLTGDSTLFSGDNASITGDTETLTNQSVIWTLITGLTSTVNGSLVDVTVIGPETLTPANKQTILAGLQSTIVHYETTDGLIIDETAYLTGAYTGATPVYLFDKELEENEAKRNIKLLDKSYLNQIVKELQNETKTRRIRGR